MLNRITSRKPTEYQAFLESRLAGATAYHRIAGYFNSSILEIAGESIENLPEGAKIVCNSQFHEAQMLQDWKGCVRSEWQNKWGLSVDSGQKERFQKLLALIKSNKLQIKVWSRPEIS